MSLPYRVRKSAEQTLPTLIWCVNFVLYRVKWVAFARQTFELYTVVCGYIEISYLSPVKGRHRVLGLFSEKDI